ncbi:MAG: hypothetical protein ABR589_00035 [Chthoniobacterales bacterium]
MHPLPFAKVARRKRVRKRPGARLDRYQERRAVALGDKRIDLFITSDQGIRYQQNLEEFPIAILQLSTNDLRRIRAAAPTIRSAVAAVRANEFQELPIP